MKRLIIAMTIAFASMIGPGFAADKGGDIRDLFNDATPVRSWSGCYVGGHIGLTVGANDSDVAGAPGMLSGIDAEAALVGIHAGCDMRLGASRWVGGIVGDYTYSGYKGGASAFGGLITGEYDVQHTLSASGRLGYLVTDRLMPFIYAGYTYGYTSDLVVTIGGATVAKVSMPDLHGWHVGTGFEFRMSDHWSVKADYRLTEFQTEDIGNTVKFENREHAIRFGMAYRF